jgi:hypothetical protein
MDSPLIPKLNAVRRRHAAVAAQTALVAVAAAGVVCLAAGMMLDRWLDLPYAARAVLLSIDGVALLALLVWRGLWPIVRGPDLEQAALWVERAVPLFASRLISAVQFLRPPTPLPAGTSPGMVRALVRQAEAAAADVDFTAVVSVRPLRRLLKVAAGVVGVVLVGFFLGGDTSVALAERALLVRGVPFPHRTRVTVLGTGDLLVVRGEPVTLSAVAAGVVPDDGRVAVRFASGGMATLPVPANGNRFDRTVDDVQEPFTYRFAIGDDQSPEYHVRTAVRPAVLGVRCRVTPPAYTDQPAADRSPWDLSMLAGSQLSLVVTASVPCFGHVRFVGTDVDVPLLGFGTSLPMMPVSVPTRATGFTVELVTTDGIKSRDPVVYRIETIPDRPPTVRLVAPVADGTLTPVARPTVVVEADDDVGVARLSLRYRITKAGQAVATDDDPNGLTGTYGDGSAAPSRVDPALDLSWAATPPPEGAGTACPVRWVGSVRPVLTDDYWIDAHFTGGCQLTVDGHRLIDQPDQTQAGPLHLQAGRLYPIEVSANAGRDGQAQLWWRGRHAAYQVIPHACLFRRTTPYAPPADVDGLVDYWPMDDADPGYARDAAGPADGTVFDATRVPGRVGRAIVLHEPDGPHGAEQHVDAPDWAGMRFAADDSFTLAIWVNLQNTTGHSQCIVSHARDGGAWYGLWIQTDGHLFASSPAGRMVGPVATPGWHHVALVQDGPAHLRTLYVDGVATVTARSQDASGSGPMVFGNVRAGTDPFDGWLDEARLYARALPADQVRALFADPHVSHVPTPAEVGGLPGGAAGTVPIELAGRSQRHVERRVTWDLAALPAPPAVGDTIDLWAEAADGNTVTGPGTAASEHRTLHVIGLDEKRAELNGQLGDYLGRVKDVSDDQRHLTAQVGSMVTPTSRPANGKNR